MEQTDILIIGAGIIGQAVAAQLSQSYDDILVLEREAKFGQHTSSRNSEVIHAGIYYPTGSLKARLCVEGRHLLYDYCRRFDVPHRQLGKLIVATLAEQVPQLEQLLFTAQQNGVTTLRMRNAAEVAALEPAVNAVAALESPETGIVDSHTLMQRLIAQAEEGGAQFVYNTCVTSLDPTPAGMVVTTASQTLDTPTAPDSQFSINARLVINCAGLAADQIAALAGIDDPHYRLHYCKGSYFSVSGKSPVSRLIYPVPHAHLSGLGIHATLDMGGRLRFGPDATYMERTLDYSIDTSKADRFFMAASQIIHGLQRDQFQPDMVGIRPKLAAAGEPVRDFVIAHEQARGVPQLINLVGIESPGLTSCLAIARHVAQLVKGYWD